MRRALYLHANCQARALHLPDGLRRDVGSLCGSYRKTCGNMICMPELMPDRLWPRLSEVLDSWRHNSRSA